MDTKEENSLRQREILKLAAPLSKEQLIEILTEASAAAPLVRQLLHKAAVASPASRRLMVRNIHYSTSDEKYFAHFRKFGDLDDAAIVRERSGRSKGFGFVTFADIAAMQRCLESPLDLDGRKLFVKVAADPFSEFVVDGVPVQGRCTRRKIFVRNLSAHCDAESLRAYFSRFGSVEDCSVVYGPSGASKGFAFVTFLKQDSAVRAAAEPQQTLEDRVIFVSMAKSSSSGGPQAPPSKATWREFQENGSCFNCVDLSSPFVPQPMTWSTTSSGGEVNDEVCLTDIIDSCLHSFSQLPERQHFPSWGGADGPTATFLPRQFTDYACGVNDSVF